MSKWTIIIMVSVLAGTGILLFGAMQKQAAENKKESDRIMNQFKWVDSSLNASNRQIDSLNNAIKDSLLKK